MKIKTIQIFDEKRIHISKVFKSLGHPTRLAILDELKKNPSLSVQEIVNTLPFSQSTVSQHLFRLKEVGLVNANLHKTSTIYTLNDDKMETFKKVLDEMFKVKKNKAQLSLFD